MTIRGAVVLLFFLLSTASFGQGLTFRRIAGTAGGGGYADGPAAAARFSEPFAVAACSEAIFIADSGNHAIRRIDRNGQVTTWAGALALPGSADGTGAAARFRLPRGIAADANCNLWVADSGNHTIRHINSSGVVITLAGAAGTAGVANGSPSAARFRNPEAIERDPAGNLWISDTGNHTIRRIAGGQVTTVAGSPGVSGRLNGTGSTARFHEPGGLAIAPNGDLLVAEIRSQTVRRVTPSGTVTTITGEGWPTDVAVSEDGTIYVANPFDRQLQRVESNRLVHVAGRTGFPEHRDGSGEEARFEMPRGLAFDQDGTLLITDATAGVIRRATTAGAVTTVAGMPVERAHVDGPGALARFQWANDVDVDASGVAWVTDLTTIRRVARDGTVSTLAGAPGERAYRDGAAGEGRFNSLVHIAVDPTGNGLVVTDGPSVRRVLFDGTITTIAGSSTEARFADGTGTDARFGSVIAVAVGSDGTIYVADAIHRAIRKISGNVVTTLHRDTTSALGVPRDIDVDEQGNVYFWDENVPAIFKVTPDGQRTTLVQNDSLSTLISGMVRAPDGTFYLGGLRVHSIRKWSGGSAIELFAGSDQSPGSQGGEPLAARFLSPGGSMGMGPDGRLFVISLSSLFVLSEETLPPPPPAPALRRRSVRR